MENKFRYILDEFRRAYNISCSLPDICYSKIEGGEIFIKEGITSAFRAKTDATAADLNVIWKTWKGVSIPFFFSGEQGEPLTESEGRWIINYDIIASSFFLLSGWQEYFSREKDVYGRFTYAKSIQNALQFNALPVVNYYFDILRTAVEYSTGKEISSRKWKEKDFTVCLTHDIDTCESAWLQGGFYALKNKQPYTALKLIFQKIRGRDAWFNFNEIIEMEKEFGANSTFFFLPADKPNMGVKNADYDVRKSKFRQVFNLILNAGSEIGVHGSVGSSTDLGLFKTGLERMGQKVSGNRFHFLLYDPKVTPGILSQSGISYDSSLGFAENYGFRNSYCLPFRQYDIGADHPLGYFEIPLVLMDGTLQKYLKKSAGESIPGLNDLLDEVKKFGGCFTVLWHNTHFSEHKYPGWKAVYGDIMQLCSSKGGWLSSCSNMLSHYKNG